MIFGTMERVCHDRPSPPHGPQGGRGLLWGITNGLLGLGCIGPDTAGVPASSTFGGDKGGQVAVSKGKVQAIQNAMRSKNCAAS